MVLTNSLTSRLASRLTSTRAMHIAAVLCLLPSLAGSKASKKLTLPGGDCNHHYQHVDGVDIEGRGLPSYTDSCAVELSTGRPEPWMFHVTDMTLMDCRVSLQVYDTYDISATSSPLFDFRCVSPDPGIVFLQTSYLRVVLQHNNVTDYHFRIIFTAWKPAARCQGFVCKNKYCIPQDLVCDGANNCFDSSDESENATAYCIKYDPFKGENFAVMVAVVGGSITIGCVTLCCRMLRRRRQKLYLEEDLEDSGMSGKKYVYMNSVLKPQRTGRKHRRKRSALDQHQDISGDEPEF